MHTLFIMTRCFVVLLCFNALSFKLIGKSREKWLVGMYQGEKNSFEDNWSFCKLWISVTGYL